MSLEDRFDSIREKHPRFSVSCRTEGEPPVLLEISLLDSLDTETSGPFVQCAEDIVSALPTVKRFHLDASKVRYLSSTGLGSVANLFMFSRSRGIDFQLVDPSPHVNMLMKLLGFEVFIPTIRTAAAS